MPDSQIFPPSKCLHSSEKRSDTGFSFITQACKIHLARYLDLRSENIKCPEESTGRKFLDIGLGNYLLANTSKEQATKTKQNKQAGHVKLKRFCTAKKSLKTKTKIKKKKPEKKHTSDKGLMSKIYRKLKQPIARKQMIQFKK